MVRLKDLLRSKTARIILLFAAAILLLIAVRLTFFGKPDDGYEPTEREARLIRLLSEIEGVGDAKALIAEEEGRAVRAIVVFHGSDSILTRARILDITAAALALEKQYVQVYPAK